ncbi:MAG: aldehyde dehydrogenase (NADP(+)) [Acidimicrobiia bacterium]|nr:aldehyde dehydrogenase (NADP(+)) [Acidimicrobiia bacterium]
MGAMTEPVLIAGKWRAAGSSAATFQAVAPATGETLAPTYPFSTSAEIETALAAGVEAAAELRRIPVDEVADFLDTFADAIEANRVELVDAAHRETALPQETRLDGIELPRTTGQLRQAAAAARDRSWSRATIDTAAGIRSKLGPLGGPVAVFGPNNFPFAFNSVSGGDFAAAIAAGNPVIAKAHPSHPTTTRLLAEAASTSLSAVGLPPATVQLVYGVAIEDGLSLAAHPDLAALAFTGRRSSGLALKAAADRAGTPVYLELGSINPVFVLPGALAERSDDIAMELFASCTLGAGQFCTNPGLVVLRGGEDADRFVAAAQRLFENGEPGVLLSPSDSISAAVDGLVAAGAEVVTGGFSDNNDTFGYANTLLTVSGADFLADPAALQAEAFGPVSLIVRAADLEQMDEIASHLEGNLTGTLYSDSEGADDAAYDDLEPALRARVGRLLNDKMPTGVAVSPAMNHGGPYPSTSHPGFTAVGIPASMNRFAALHCYDNVRHHRLPPELQDPNPTGAMWRLIDGSWSQADIA